MGTWETGSEPLVFLRFSYSSGANLHGINISFPSGSLTTVSRTFILLWFYKAFGKPCKSCIFCHEESQDLACFTKGFEGFCGRGIFATFAINGP